MIALLMGFAYAASVPKPVSVAASRQNVALTEGSLRNTTAMYVLIPSLD